jgi:hypothetical protein
MATFAEGLRPMLAACRGIAGSLGLHLHAVEVLDGTWSGTYTGDGTESLVVHTIREAGQNPKVRWLTDEQAALAECVGGVEIGPLTPRHDVGGTELATLTGSALTTGKTLHVRITGPKHPSGSRYVVQKLSADSALHYMLTCRPA